VLCIKPRSSIGRRKKKFLSHDKDLRHVNLIRIAGASTEAYDIYDLTRLKPLIFVGGASCFQPVVIYVKEICLIEEGLELISRPIIRNIVPATDIRLVCVGTNHHYQFSMLSRTCI
jgi:hypothetical protein